MEEREGNFAVKDSKEISKIILTDKEKKRIELADSSGVWFVNGKYRAREDLMQSILEAITRVVSRSPVPAAAHDNVILDMSSKGVHVEVFDSDNELLKSYWVGGPTIDGQNTYMLLEETGTPVSRPHMTYIPGFKGYLTNRFNTDEEIWRTRQVFNYQPEEIKSLHVEYPGDEAKSFSITRVAEDSFSLSPLNEKFRLNSDYKQKYIRQYLAFYSSIYLEAFQNDYAKKDSVVKTTPYCIITVRTGNSVNEVKMFYMPVSKRSKTQFDSKGNEMTYDVDRYFASLNNGRDFAIVQYYVFGKLLRSYQEFFFKPV